MRMLVEALSREMSNPRRMRTDRSCYPRIVAPNDTDVFYNVNTIGGSGFPCQTSLPVSSRSATSLA